MSTIKATNFQHPSAASPGIELDAAGKVWLAGGKILQVVRATDLTQRTTTSTSFVDVTGCSITITPQKSTSSILLIFVFAANPVTNIQFVAWTDSSNNGISGAETTFTSNAVVDVMQTIFAYATPATTSAQTYKIRFRTGGGTARIGGNSTTSQLYAIEVSA